MTRSEAAIRVLPLRVEQLRETLGVGVARPRLSWTVECAAQNWRQSAYEIECLGADGQSRGQTGWVESDASVLVAWPFEPLRSRERVSLRVRIRGSDKSVSDWSGPTALEAGLLEVGDWDAHFVTPGWDEDTSQSNPAPYLRREFTVRPGVISARLYVTALGVYEVQVNGSVVGDQVLSPGWTVYDERLRYQTFDVKEMLHTGDNVVGAILGDGWYRGRLGFGGGRRNVYGEHLALLAQLEVNYEDGSRERLVTDESWRAATGPILASSLYDGETYDARLEQTDWSLPGFDETGWSNVRELESHDLGTLESPVGPPVRRIERMAPISISKSPSGRAILDFGQNLVGRLSFSVQGAAGQTITLRHAEVLEDGELCTRPLRFAEATDRYTLRGGGAESWEPRFTFHGFRFAEVDGWPGELNPSDINAVVLHSDMERTGWFECSDSLLNRFHENVVWSMRGNFLDIPTDCPQRDERLGWTGDIQVFSPTASFLYDTSGFLQSWLVDLAIEQRKLGGLVPNIVPNALGQTFCSAAWGDAATFVPWVLYKCFGDVGILAAQFESMRSWVDYVASVAGENRLWGNSLQLGDWLDPTAPPDRPYQARTSAAVVAGAYFARSAELVGRAAGVLGRGDDKERYLTLAAEVRAAFAREYVTPAGRLMSDAETAYVLALVFDLFDTAEQRRRAGERLADLVRESGNHIRTGFVGTPLICDALCSTGHHLAAYRLLMQRGCPSWLYPVTMGATTIWERWDSMLPDGSINPGEMTSFNHYALGAVADWMHRFVGGLAPAEAGYRRMEIRPHPGGGLTYCRTSHLTPYGLAECAWKIEGEELEVAIIVPPNASATVILPGDDQLTLEVGSGSWRWSIPYRCPDIRSPFTLDDVVGEVMDDSDARKAVTEAISESIGGDFLRFILENERSMSVREVLRLAPNPDDLLARVAAALSRAAEE